MTTKDKKSSSMQKKTGRGKYIYLEVKDVRKGLLVEVINETETRCIYSVTKALGFQSVYKARKFIKENRLTGQFKPITIEIN